MMDADRVIRWTTAGAVVGVAAVAAVASYEHAYALVRAHGEAGWTGHLVPLTLDGLIYASSMVMLDSARHEMPGSGASAMAPRPGRCGDSRGQCGSRFGTRADRCGRGGMASSCAGGLLRTSHDGHPKFADSIQPHARHQEGCRPVAGTGRRGVR